MTRPIQREESSTRPKTDPIEAFRLMSVHYTINLPAGGFNERQTLFATYFVFSMELADISTQLR